MLGTAGAWQRQQGRHWSQRGGDEPVPHPGLTAESRSRVPSRKPEGAVAENVSLAISKPGSTSMPGIGYCVYVCVPRGPGPRESDAYPHPA